MKIAILSATFSQFSGIDRVVARQAEDLARQGHQVTIMALRADMPAQTVSVQELGMPSSLIAQRVFRLLLPLFFWRVNNYLNKLKEFEVIYSHQYPMNYLAAKAKQKYGAKYIYYNHGVAPSWTFSNWWEKIYIKKFNWLTNQSIKPANQIISISNYLQQVLKKETRRDSQVVYDQIDTKRFHPGIDGSQIRQQYQISQDPLILYVGRLSPHKGIDLLIEAFNQVRKQLPSAKLLIVGKPTFATYQ
ncbi:glycosyltransferase family 4 protein, partial [Patescibacteria group bacterium]|nr:glycosyltransferase family 4 protein [Patescibacteria group bacterium]